MTANLLADPADDAKFEVPAKFKDAKTGELRIDALLKSYVELEKRLARSLDQPKGPDDVESIGKIRKVLGVPDDHTGYACQMKDPNLYQDPEIDQRLHAAGFTPEQAQLVYDLAAEYVMPTLAEMGENQAFERHRETLHQHFGGEEPFRQVSRQITAWGKKHLPPQVFDALTSSHQGVIALQHMMKSGEPGLMRGAAASETDSDEELDRMMRDPRYWRDRDPQHIAKVTEGFKRLYRS